MQTERLHLKKLSQKDIKALVKIANDKDIAKYTEHLPFPFRDVDAINLIKGKEDSKQFGIFCKKQLVGVIELYKIKSDQAKLGYWIGKTYRNKGYAQESVEKMLIFAFQKLKLNSVLARTRIENIYSIKILKNLGFLKIENFKEDGKRYYRFSLTNPYLY